MEEFQGMMEIMVSRTSVMFRVFCGVGQSNEPFLAKARWFQPAASIES